MIAPATIAQRLTASRLVVLHRAVVANLAPLFPGVTVRRHPGRIDIGDLLKKDIVPAPALLVAISRIRPPRDMEGSYQLAVDFAAYAIAEDTVVAGKRAERDEVGHVLADGVLAVLRDEQAPRWGLQDITDPLDEPQPEMRPLFSALDFERGVAVYATTWSQALIGRGGPVFDFEPLPQDLDVTLLLPGDEGYEDPPPPLPDDEEGEP